MTSPLATAPSFPVPRFIALHMQQAAKTASVSVGLKKRPSKIVQLHASSIGAASVVQTTRYSTRNASSQLGHGTRSQPQRTWPLVLHVNYTSFGQLSIMHEDTALRRRFREKL
eukprot:6201583-Pleurochrysis_carterae.AAC.1